jgi:nucleoside-diphosphate-sugar epimerase
MNILIIGAGHCGRAIAKAARVAFPQSVIGMTARDGLLKSGFDYVVNFIDDYDFKEVTHLVVTAPPSPVDPFLARFGKADFSKLQHVLYLSTTAVYGDHGGAWIDENTPANPTSDRAKRRLYAENAWSTRFSPCCLFRLSGLYGDNRNALDDLRNGDARRIDKLGQVFNRIHHDDVARASVSLMKQAYNGIVNGADDEPAASHEVIAYAARLLNITSPPLISYEDAVFSEMAKSFWAENKRISNARLKALTGAMTYPSYREGLSSLLTHQGS